MQTDFEEAFERFCREFPEARVAMDRERAVVKNGGFIESNICSIIRIQE